MRNRGVRWRAEIGLNANQQAVSMWWHLWQSIHKLTSIWFRNYFVNDCNGIIIPDLYLVINNLCLTMNLRNFLGYETNVGWKFRLLFVLIRRLTPNFLVACDNWLILFSGMEYRENKPIELHWGNLKFNKTLSSSIMHLILCKKGLATSIPIWIGTRTQKYFQEGTKSVDQTHFHRLNRIFNCVYWRRSQNQCSSWNMSKIQPSMSNFSTWFGQRAISLTFAESSLWI